MKTADKIIYAGLVFALAYPLARFAVGILYGI
jgi:hypothetical protein